jgi:hypothetical protein
VGHPVEQASHNARVVVLLVALLVVSRMQVIGITSLTSVCPNANGVRRRGIRDPLPALSPPRRRRRRRMGENLATAQTRGEFRR